MKSMKWFIIVLISSLPISNALAMQDILGMLQTFDTNIGPISNLVVAVAYVLGLFFIADSIFRLKKYGQARTMMSTNASMAKPLILMGIGVSLLYFPTFVQTSVYTFWAYSSSNSILQYPAEPSMFNAFVHPLIDIIRLFGLIAVVRGLVILTKTAAESSQPGTVGKGIVHVIAGTFAINIVGTINVIQATFGF